MFENLVSNEAGLVSQSDIKPGTYHLIETQAPTGYIINSEPSLEISNYCNIEKLLVMQNDI